METFIFGIHIKNWLTLGGRYGVICYGNLHTKHQAKQHTKCLAKQLAEQQTERQIMKQASLTADSHKPNVRSVLYFKGNHLYDGEDLTYNNNSNWFATTNADVYDADISTCHFSFTEIGTQNEESNSSYENNGINNSSIGCNQNNSSVGRNENNNHFIWLLSRSTGIMNSIFDMWRNSQQGSPCTEKSISMMEDCYANEGTQRINMRKAYCLLTRLVNQCSCFKFKGLGCIFGKEYNILSKISRLLLSFAILSGSRGCVEIWKCSIGGVPFSRTVLES